MVSKSRNVEKRVNILTNRKLAFVQGSLKIGFYVVSPLYFVLYNKSNLHVWMQLWIKAKFAMFTKSEIKIMSVETLNKNSFELYCWNQDWQINNYGQSLVTNHNVFCWQKKLLALTMLQSNIIEVKVINPLAIIKWICEWNVSVKLSVFSLL